MMNEMKRILLLISIFTTILIKANAQVDTLKLKDLAYQNGVQMVDAFQNEDYDNFLDLTHPKIIEMSGGKVKMKEMFKQGIGNDFEFIKTELKKPETIIIKDSIVQCSLEQRQEMKMSGDSYYTLGYLIGLSYDLGRTWYFIGVAGNTLEKLKVYFPELSSNLKIKAQTRPIRIN